MPIGLCNVGQEQVVLQVQGKECAMKKMKMGSTELNWERCFSKVKRAIEPAHLGILNLQSPFIRPWLVQCLEPLVTCVCVPSHSQEVDVPMAHPGNLKHAFVCVIQQAIMMLSEQFS